MANHTRKEFFRLSAAAATAVGTDLWPTAAWGQRESGRVSADLVLLNGRVYTVEREQPRAQAGCKGRALLGRGQ